jgi:hypothetical protein
VRSPDYHRAVRDGTPGPKRWRRPVRFGSLRRTSPVSGQWGFDRGTPIDRYFIEKFLDERRADISGACLEIKDRAYTHRFGSEVARSEVLDIDASNPQASIVADLTDASAVTANQFDCFILAQTLQFIYDLEAAIHTSHFMLNDGGVLLLTVPAVTRIDRGAAGDRDLWRFTPAACATLLRRSFAPGDVSVHSYGNVLTAVAFLMGLSAEELSPAELDYHDEFFPVLVCARAVKS